MLLAAFLLLGVSSLLLLHLDEAVVKKFEGQRWKLPSKIYSAPLKLAPGLDITKAGLMPRLKRLSYHAVDHPVQNPGEFFRDKGRLEVYLHPFDYPDYAEAGLPIALSISDKNQILSLTDLKRDIERDDVLIEPEVVGGFYESEWEERTLVRLSEVPEMLIDAVIAMEDRRFFDHTGINLKSIVRAAWVNVRAGRIVQGGSTLTQQLVKNFYLGSERTFARKAREALMALLLERRYDKEEILEVYLNEIYFGQNGIMGIYGLGQGAWFYFEKAPKDLTLGEAALLAGIIRAPNVFSPVKDIHKAIRRRNLVLEVLFTEGKISLQDYFAARGEKVVAKRLKQRLNTAPYFVDEIRRQVAGLYPPRILNSGGLKIFSTLDTELQRIAEKTLKKGLEDLELRDSRLKQPGPGDQLQGALVAIDPKTGAVKAMVGGRDYQTSQFNRVTDARRQPGSLFKPIVYLAAFEQAARGGTPYTPISEIDDAPVTLSVGGKEWSPENYDHQYLGPITLRRALEASRNTATVRLSQEVGMPTVVNMARELGIKSPLKPVPSLALGSIEVSPLEMGVAYSTLADGGVFHPARFIHGMIDPRGLPIEQEEDDSTDLRSRRVVSESAVFLVTHLMRGVVDSGTGQDVRRLGFAAPAAGKTGTSSKLRDAWFVGYTPDLVTVVWVGFDKNQRGALTGASAALPIWTEFMKRASFSEPRDFTPPEGVVLLKVNQSGKICEKDGLEEAFIVGTEPTQNCEKGILKWIRRLFF
ncbi:MAG: PBP1A family penicillin-binding protein [Nitrospiria bacterium]